MASLSLHDDRMTAAAPVEVRALDQFVTFTCSGRAFGIDIMSVREIRSWSPSPSGWWANCSWHPKTGSSKLDTFHEDDVRVDTIDRSYGRDDPVQ